MATTTDKEALDRIQAFMNQPSSDGWNGGDVCEMVAEVLTDTGRHVCDDWECIDHEKHPDRCDECHETDRLHQDGELRLCDACWEQAHKDEDPEPVAQCVEGCTLPLDHDGLCKP